MHLYNNLQHTNKITLINFPVKAHKLTILLKLLTSLLALNLIELLYNISSPNVILVWSFGIQKVGSGLLKILYKKLFSVVEYCRSLFVNSQLGSII